MASACLNNNVTVSPPPDNFIDCSTFPSYGSWLTPRVSFSREFPDGVSDTTAKLPSADLLQFSDLAVSSGCNKDDDVGDFEFRLEEDPVTILPADELFFDGKLMPLHVSTDPVETLKKSTDSSSLTETAKCRRKADVSSADVANLFSPKAPRCSSKWKEMLGLRKLYQNSNNTKSSSSTVSSNSSSSSNVKSLKHLLHRSSRSSSSSADACLNLPLLLKESDSESVSISSRLSLSSSSSGHEHEDLPRLSLDTEKPSINSIFQLKCSTMDLNNTANPPPRLRLIKPRPSPSPNAGPLIDHPSATMVDRNTMRRVPAESCTVTTHNGVTADSPRMNPSGKIVFQSLERSSSSPSSFNQHHHHKKPQMRGMERSYSANVRVTPVLNVPVCSSLRGSGGVFGFGQLFSTPQKKENGSGGGSSHGGGGNSRNRSDRNR